MPTNSSATSVNERPDERDPGLLDHHRQFLTDRAVSPTVAAARGYSSTVMPGYLRQFGISIDGSKQIPGLVIPVHDVHGDLVFHQYRPDTPRTRAGKPAKYELPTKARMVLDAPRPTQPKLDDPAVPLWVTEAPVKADAICSAGGVAVATFGVWGFKGRNRRGGSTMLACWDWIALKGRTVYLVPDSDVATNPKVSQAVSRLGVALESRSADVRYCTIPAKADGAKVGVDDFLAGGGTLQDLAANADDEPPAGSRPNPEGEPAVAAGTSIGLFRPADDRFTDARMAETVAADVLADRFIWVVGLDWLTWDGRRWAACADVTISEQVRQYALKRFASAVTDLQAGSGDMAALDGWRDMLQASKEAAVLRLARGIVKHEADELDADPELLNTPSGAVNLRTGAVLDPSPKLLMTKITKGAYRPGCVHPDWNKALEALDGPEREWLQVRIGQAITGHPPSDDVLVFLQGSGENGKSALTTGGTVPALGDYASMASTKLIQTSKGSEHSTERADLRGRRLLVAEELTEGRAIDVTALKQLQGVGRIRARYVYKDNMEFDASHSLLATTNYIPVVAEVDHGTWRRLALLRFRYTFRKPGENLVATTDRRGDPGLRGRIKAGEDGQHDAVVTWAIEGALRYYQAPDTALAPTAKVAADTRAWRTDADRVLGFWDEKLIVDPGACIVTSEALVEFNAWLAGNGHNGWAKELFGPRFLQHEETIRHGVAEGRPRTLEGLSRPASAGWEPPPARPRVYRGVRFRGPGDPLPGDQEPSDGGDNTDNPGGNGHDSGGGPSGPTPQDFELYTRMAESSKRVGPLGPTEQARGRDPGDGGAQRDPDRGGGGLPPDWEWQFSNEPIGPCAECGGDCHTPGPDGEPIHPLCFNPAGGRSWQGTAAWKADGRPGLAGPSGGNE